MSLRLNKFVFLLVFCANGAFADMDYDNPNQRAYEQDQAYKQQIQIDNMQRQMDAQRYQPQVYSQPQIQYIPVYGDGTNPTQ